MPEDLGDLPEPTVQPPERFPGGVDAFDDEEKYGDIPDEPLTPDRRPSQTPPSTRRSPTRSAADEQDAPMARTTSTRRAASPTPRRGRRPSEPVSPGERVPPA